jgi:putative transposase
VLGCWVHAIWLRVEYAASEHRVCGLMGIAMSTYRYRRQRTDEPLRTLLVELARSKPRFGYRRLHVLLRRSGEAVNRKRLHRVYREAGMAIRRKKRKPCVREGKPLLVRTAANQEWALDFVHDAVECGRTIRVLSVVDAYTRECLALEVDTSFASRRVTRVLDQIITERGRPEAIRCDNGPELTSRHFLAWSGGQVTMPSTIAEILATRYQLSLLPDSIPTDGSGSAWSNFRSRTIVVSLPVARAHCWPL